MIIGIAGYALHGKDEIGKVLANTYGFTRIALSDTVCELALVVDPVISLAGYPFNNGFEDLVVESGSFWRLSAMVDKFGWPKAKLIPDVRRVLQNLGNGARHVLYEDLWVDKLFENHNLDGTSEHYVITGLRYLNEAERIRQSGGLVWRVTRPDFDNGVDPNHPSERNVPKFAVDHDFTNSGTIADLEKLVNEECERFL